jgi:hypothetical protein
MSLILSLSDYKNSLKKSQKISFFKDKIDLISINYRFGHIIDTWILNGNPAAGTTPATVNGSLLTKQSTGGLPFRSAADGKNIYLAGINFSALYERLRVIGGAISPEIGSGLIHVWDRVWHSGNISSNATTNFTSFPSLTRYSSGDGLSLWLTKYSTAQGSSISVDSTYTITYKNQNDETNVVVFVYKGSTDLIYQRTACYQFPLLSGDTGIRSISQLINSAASATGDHNLMIAKYYGAFPFVSLPGFQTNENMFESILPVHNDACLTFGIQFNYNQNSSYYNTTDLTPGCMGEITLIEA